MQIPEMSKDMDEQLKLSRKLVVVVHRANRKIGVTLVRYKMDQPDSSFAQVRNLQRRRSTRNFNNLSMWNKKFEENFHLLDVMNSVYDKVITNLH